MVCLFNTVYFLYYEGNLEFLIRRRIFFLILVDSALTFSKKKRKRTKRLICLQRRYAKLNFSSSTYERRGKTLETLIFFLCVLFLTLSRSLFLFSSFFKQDFFSFLCTYRYLTFTDSSLFFVYFPFFPHPLPFCCTYSFSFVPVSPIPYARFSFFHPSFSLTQTHKYSILHSFARLRVLLSLLASLIRTYRPAE